jgi:hypothetical protein
MTFVCTLDGTLPDIVVLHGPPLSVIAPIGYDDAEPLTFFAVTALGQSGGGLVEFLFQLEIYDERSDSRAFIQSGLSVPFISKVDRAYILDLILVLTDQLLINTGEKEIYRHTFDIDPPPKALEKHRKISHVFRQCGYAVTETGPLYGVYSWRAVKRA